MAGLPADGCSLSVVVVGLLLLAAGGRHTEAHTYHTGECPSVEPMSGFDMSQFLGIWYAVQKTSTASSCLVYNITRGPEPGAFSIEQTSQHFAIGLTPIKHEYSYTGELSVPDRDVPAKMRVRFPLSVAGESTFTVFLTDYTQFAGIFSCQKIAVAHRQSATLLSRTPGLDKLYVDKLRSRLSSYSVNPFDLSIINQTGCPADGRDGYNIAIDSDTFSASSIASVFRKAGEKIGDGVEWTIGAGKKVYNRLTDGDSGEQLQNGEKKGRTVQTASSSIENDAEWMRI